MEQRRPRAFLGANRYLYSEEFLDAYLEENDDDMADIPWERYRNNLPWNKRRDA